MKTFNAFKTFFSLLAVSGVVLLGVLRAVLGSGDDYSLFFANFTVIFFFIVGPLCLLLTRLQAVRNGQGFLPKGRGKTYVHLSPPVKKRNSENFVHLNDPLSGSFGLGGFIMGWDIFDSPIEKRKKRR